MIRELKNIANQIANGRIRLYNALQGDCPKDEILKEIKNLESLELYLRTVIDNLKDKLEELTA